MKLSCLRLLVPVCGLLAACLPTLGQVNTATIYGSVTDPTQAGIPGAQAELKNDLTGIATETPSNADGQFTFSFVPVGTYTLT
ncbi:MAG: carboxypeptidase-like regulatory domain-containing protein, partial [Bryobacteraceae bacterium]